MPKSVLVIKGVTVAKRNWKKLLITGSILLVLPIFFPIALFTIFLPSAEPAKINIYQSLSNDLGFDWGDLVAFDTVRYENDFSKAHPDKTALEFINVNYKVFEKRVEVVQENNSNGFSGGWIPYPTSSNTFHSNTLATTKVVTTWVLTRSGEVEGMNDVVSLAKSFGYSGNASARSIISFFTNLTKTDEYEIIVNKLTLEDVVDSMDNNHKQWAFQLSSMMHNIYSGINENKEYYLQEGSKKFCFPSPEKLQLTSPYGERIHPITGKLTFHYGVDLATSGCMGKPVIAIADGVVSEANYSNGISGLNVRIKHSIDGDEWQSRYCHLASINVSVGQNVVQGQTIGTIGSTGRRPNGQSSSTGPHIHFELKYKGGLVDPWPYISK